jgi:endonuclease YncB( thermonuclease family)
MAKASRNLWLSARACSLVIVTALVSSAAIAGPRTREGRVVSIQDSDTFTLLDSDKAKAKIRFARADGTER